MNDKPYICSACDNPIREYPCDKCGYGSGLIECPECLRKVSGEEILEFGGLCEECGGFNDIEEVNANV